MYSIPFIRLLKEREALHTKGEEYKSAFTKYMRSKGYEPYIDSAIEGTFEDQIYFSKDNFRVSVECKDSEVAVFSDDFLIPFGVNLAKFARSASKERFMFVYCARKFGADETLEMAFDELDPKSAHEILGRAILALRKSGRANLLRIAEVLGTVPPDTLIQFIENSQVVEASYVELEMAANAEPTLIQSPLLLSLGNPAKASEMISQMAVPESITEELATNIFRVQSMPSRVSSAVTPFRKAVEVLDGLGAKAEGAPPFILRDGRLYTFSNLEDESDTLHTVCSGEIESYSVAELASDSARSKYHIELMNKALHLHLRNMDLVTNKGKYFVPSRDQRGTRIKWNTGTRIARRDLVTCYLDQAKKKISFCKHRALRIFFKAIGGEPYLVVSPGFFFTSDGISALNPRLTTKLSSGAWAKHGNNSLLYDIRFWANFIAKGAGTIRIETGSSPIEVQTIQDVVKMNVGIHGDTLPRSSVLEPITRPQWRLFGVDPWTASSQTTLDDELDMDLPIQGNVPPDEDEASDDDHD